MTSYHCRSAPSCGTLLDLLPQLGAMQLSNHSDYVLRVLLYLAVRPGERCTLSEISEFYRISLDHLRKVVHELSKAGYLNTFRGKGGGMELAKPARKINVGQVLAEFEGRKALIDCKGLSCRLAQGCALRRALDQAQTAFYNSLREFSVEDLIGKPGMPLKLGRKSGA